MAGSMSQADLVADLRSSLNDAANVFTAAGDADFIRHLNQAAADFSRVRSRTLLGSITLVADQLTYDPPADLQRPKVALWGRAERQRLSPWDDNWPGDPASLTLVEDGGEAKLAIDPIPTQHQISLLGATCQFYYFAAHQIGVAAADTTIQSNDRDLLMLRAQAEACKELALRNHNKPVDLRGSAAPRNSTPAALAEWLMEQFAKQGGLRQ